MPMLQIIWDHCFFNDETGGEFIREEAQYCGGAQINPETKALATTIPEGENLAIGPPIPKEYIIAMTIHFGIETFKKNVDDRIGAYFSNKGK